MRHLVAALLVAATAACSSPRASCPTPRPAPEKPAESKTKLHLSAPLAEWVELDTEGFTVRFPPGWKMGFHEKAKAWACTAEGHTCMFKWGSAKFGAGELLGYLTGRASTIKVIPVTIEGDDAVVWAGYDSDGDPWINTIRFHEGVAFHFAYFGAANKIPDDFFVVPTTLLFKPEPAKPKDETSL